MANSVVSVGRGVTSATTGSAVNLVPNACKLLGFWASATGALTVYDSATTATTGQQGPAFTACAVGWNPMPLDLLNGLTVNQAAQLL